MTFEDWWKSQGYQEGDTVEIELSAMLGGSGDPAKEIAKAAWDASRNCPKCGRDLRLTYCPDCKTAIR